MVGIIGVVDDLSSKPRKTSEDAVIYLPSRTANTSSMMLAVHVLGGGSILAPRIRAIAADCPDVALVAIGLKEQRQEVIQCGRAGYAGYVSRDASIDTLCSTLSEIVAGRLVCPPEISSSLLRALFHNDAEEEESAKDPFFKKVLDSQRAYAKVTVPYTRETSKLSTLISGAAEP